MSKWLNSNSRIYFALASIGLVSLLFASYLIVNSRSPDPTDDKNTISLPLESAEKTIPVRIKIPSIGVDAVVKPVGLTELKTMESPEEPGDTFWFSLGASPGERGSAVIAGHRGWRVGPAIFDDLDQIKPGDQVQVQDDGGATLTFVVRELRVYGANELAPEVWNQDDAAHLNLITCSGDWDTSRQAFPERLVVFTDLAT